VPLEKVNLRWPAELRDRLEAVRGDRSVNICLIRAVEAWVEAEESGTPLTSKSPITVRRGNKGTTIEEKVASEELPKRTPSVARRRRPTTSQKWGR